MDNYTILPLYGYRIKYIGIVICILAITLLFFTEKVQQLPFMEGYSQDECIILLLCLNGIALYFIAFSKESNEDERIALIRDKTFRVSFASVISALIAVTVSQMIFSRGFNNDKAVPISVAYLFFAALLNVGLITQILVFYYRIYTNSDLKSYDFTVSENLRNNKKLYIGFAALYIVGIIALILL